MPTLTIDDIKVEVPEGTTVLQAGPPGRTSGSRPSATSTTCSRSAPAASAWSRSKAPARWSPRAPAGDRRHGREDQLRQGPQGPQDRRRAAALRARRRLPDLRRAAPTASCAALAEELGIGELRYEGEKTRRLVDDSTPALVRDTGKCIMCRRCVTVCNDIQGVGGLFAQGRGFTTADRPGLRQRPQRRGLRPVRPVRRRLPGRRDHRAQRHRARLGRARRPRPRPWSCRPPRRSAPRSASASTTSPARW